MAEGLPEADFEQPDNRLRTGALVLFFAGLFVLALGAGLFFFKTSNSNDDIQIISASQGEALQGLEIVVHVDGAVVKPGVYTLAAGSRVNDALVAAGGLTEGADRAKINLAAKVADGQKIYVIAQGEQLGASVVGVAGETQPGLVSINGSSQSELEGLPGIGPVTAQKIIASRPYSALEDLLNRKVVNKSVWEKIKDLISL